MKKILSFTLIAVGLLFSANMWAQNVAKVTIGGTSTNYTDLHEALEAGKAKGAEIELLSNVNLTGVAWIPVGTEASPFEGTLDGKNFTITGLNVEVESSAALIGCCSGNNTVVKNVTFDGATIKATTGNYAAVVIAQWNAKSIENVTVKNSTITAAGEKAAGITAGAYIECHNCTVDNCVITCTEQPGAIASYVAGTPIIGCKSLNNTITATASRAGGLVGKYECDDNGDTNLYKLNNNVVSNCTVTAPDKAGALAGEIMGAFAAYEMKNNVLDATLSATQTSPIGVLRAGQNAAFTGALAANITGNWWTDATSEDCQFTYINVASGVDPQTIDRGVAKIDDDCYETLADAVAAATTGETITLIANIAAPNSNVFLRFANNVTLDLNGKTITSGVIDENGNYDYVDGNAYVYEGTNLTIQNGTMVAINKNNLPQNYYYAAFIGNDEDGAIPTSNVTVKNVTCEGGVNVYGATVTFVSCDVTSKGAYYAVWADENAVATISSGTYTGSIDAATDHDGNIVINGGTYSINPDSKYIASGLKSQLNPSTGKYEIVEDSTPIAKIGSTTYSDLATALNACQAGETVELLSNVDLNNVAWTPISGFGGTFDGKGFTISNVAINADAEVAESLGAAGLFAACNGTIKNVIIDGITVVGYEYVGALVGSSTANIQDCQVLNATIKGAEQVGGIAGYVWCGSLTNNKFSGNVVAADRAGGLIGKFQMAEDNNGGPTATYKMLVNGNRVSGTITLESGSAKGLIGQIMGDCNRYEIKDNSIDIAGITSPIGTLRDGQNAAFTGALEENITGNWWSDATLNADSYQYTNVASGVEVQTIYRKQPYTRQVATGNWATMCYPDSITVVTGATIYQITAINSAKTQVALDVVDVLSMIPGKAYLFNATANNQSFTAFPGSSVAEPVQNNGLIGTFASIKLQEQAWVLTNNTITPAAVGSTVGQYRCYIDLDEVSVDDTQFTSNAPGRRFFGVRGVATNVEELMFDNAQCTKVIINGQFVIVKDGKMFNAQGAQL